MGGGLHPLLPLTPEIRTRLARGETLGKPPAHLVRVIVVSYKIRNKEELGQIFTPDGAIQGMIVSSVRSMGKETENMLQQNYPGINLDNVLLLEQGRKPTSQELLTALFAGGGLLIGVSGLLGGCALVHRWRR